ncbi:acyltransferase family protein [Nocardia sp. NPDC052566]|uniref:acyltransferase family protein n=1 Tax=Nocardia sp. NPDC052566 TaxID=3364330 RepID=UPI0037C89DC2
MTTTTTSPRRIAMPKSVWSKLTGLRGVCAFYVLISHIWFQVWPAAEPPLGYGTHPDGALYWLTSWLYHGHFAVIAFIVVSGYSLQTARIGRGEAYTTLGFLKRRCRRILPPYYAAMVASAIVGLTVAATVTGSQWDISIPVTWSSLVSHTLLLQDFVDFTKINYAHWSIAAEFHLYLLFPFFLWMIGRIGERWGTLATATAVVALVACLMISSDAPAFFVGLILYFFLGIVTANYAARSEYAFAADTRKLLRRTATGILMLVMAVSVAVGFDIVETILPVFDLGVAAGICLLILGFLPTTETPTESATSVGRQLVQKWIPDVLERMGRFSYSLYLVHAPIVMVVWMCLGGNDLTKPTMFVALMATAVPAALIVTYVFYRVFEKPFT